MTTTKHTNDEGQTLEASATEVGEKNLPAVTGDSVPLAYAEGGALVKESPWDDISDDEFDLTPEQASKAGLMSIPLVHMDRNIGAGFVNEETGEKSTVLEPVVWAARGMSRAFFVKAWNPQAEATAPDCRSADGVTSDPASPNRVQEKCAGCPMAEWGDNDAKPARLEGPQREKPACRAATEALVFLPHEDGTLDIARMRFAGIAKKWADGYWTSFENRLPKMRPIGMVARIELVEEDTDFGPKLSPRFTRLQELSRAAAGPLIDETRRRMEEWRNATLSDLASGGAAESFGEGEGSARSARSYEPFPDEEPPADESAVDDEPDF